MRHNKIIKFERILVVLIVIFALISNSYADLMVPDFRGVGPQNHIYKTFTEERKIQLKDPVIYYEYIEDSIHLFNPEVRNNWNVWENNKSSQDIYDDYMDAVDSLSGGSGDSEVADAMAKAQADAMRIQADKNADDSYTNFVTYLMAEKSLVLNTQIMYMNYLKSLYTIENTKEYINECVRKKQTAENNLSYGNGTRLEVLQANKNLVDAESKLALSDSNMNTYKRNIIINMGRSMSDDCVLMDVNLDSIINLDLIDKNKDYETALLNNYQYEIYKKRKENAQSEEVRNQYQINIDSAPNNIYNDIDQKYNDILDALDTFNNKSVALKLANDTLTKAKNEYEHGNISDKQLKSEKYNINTANVDVKIAKYDVYIAFINYYAAVNGLASC